MAVDNLLPENDFFDFTQPDNGAMIFTDEGQTQDPPAKKKLRTVADVPQYKQGDILPRKKYIAPPNSFAPLEQSLVNFKKAQEKYDYLRFDANKIRGGARGSVMPADPALQINFNNFIPEYNNYLNAKNKFIKETAPVFEGIANDALGNYDEIAKGGKEIAQFIAYDDLGIPFVDNKKIVQAASTWNANLGGGAYTQSQLEAYLKVQANDRLLYFRALPGIKKRIGDKNLELSNEYIASIAPFKQEALLLKNKLQTQVELYNKGAKEINGYFEPLMADIIMDMNFTKGEVVDEVTNEMLDETLSMKGEQMAKLLRNMMIKGDRNMAVEKGWLNSAPEAVTELDIADAGMDLNFKTDEVNWRQEFQKRFEEKLLPRIQPFVEETLQPMYDNYVAAMKEQWAKSKTATDRIYKEYTSLQDRKKAFDNKFKTKEDAIRNTEYQQIVKEEFEKVLEGDNNKVQGYTYAMNNMPIELKMKWGTLFGQGFLQSFGSATENIANFLNSLGLSNENTDDMKGWGANLSRQNSIYGGTLRKDYMESEFWANSMGKMFGFMAPMALTTIATRNPMIAATAGSMFESAVMGGQQFQDALNNGKTADEAATDAQNMFITNLPIQFASDFLFSKFFTGLGKKGVLGAAGELGINATVQGGQEIYQGGLQGSIGTNKGFWESALSRENIDAGIEAGVNTMLTGAPGVVVSGLLQIKTKVPSSAVQHIAHELMNKGTNRTLATGEQMAFIDEADNETLVNYKESVAKVEQRINEAKNIGLNVQQQQVYVAAMDELDGLQMKRSATSGVAAEVIDGQIAEKKKEIAAIVKGEQPLASVEAPGTFMFTGTPPQIGEILNIPEIREGIKNGVVRIVTQDNGLNKQVEEIVKENEAQQQEQTPQTEIPYEPIAEALFDAMPNVQGIYGRMLEMVANPDQQQYVVDAVIDQYNNDFEAASARYGDKVTEMVKPFLQQEKQAANDYSNTTWYRGKSNLNEQSQDSFFSASQSIAGDYGSVSELTKEERPKNPFVLGSKEDLVDEIGYDGDPLAEPLDTPVAERFDTKAREYAISKGYDAIIYESGTFDEPELHLFGKLQQPNQQPQNQNNNAEMQGQEGRQEVAPATNNAPPVVEQTTADVGAVKSPDVSPKPKKKRPVKLTRQERVNNLIDAIVKADNTSNKTEKAKQINEIKKEAQSLNKSFPKNKVVFNQKRMQLQSANGNEMQKRGLTTNKSKVQGFSRDQYSDATNTSINRILEDETLALGLNMRGADGRRLSAKQMAGAIAGIRDGKVTEAGRELFDYIEQAVNDGGIEIEDVASGQKILIPIEEYFAATKEVEQMYEEGTMPMSEDEVMAWMEEEAANNYEETTFDNVDNLLQYEQDITTTGTDNQQQPQTETGVEQGATEQEGTSVGATAPGAGTEASPEQLRKGFLNKVAQDFDIYNKLPRDRKQRKLNAMAQRLQAAKRDGIISEEDFDNVKQRIDADYEALGSDVRVDEIGVPDMMEGMEGEGLDAKPSTKEQAKQIADKIRSFQKPNDRLYGGFLGLPVAIYNGMLSTIAAVIEAGGTVAEAIEKAVAYIKANSDKGDKQVRDAVTEHMKLLGFTIPAQQEQAPNEPPPPQEPQQQKPDGFESKQGKKSLLNRAYEGQTDDEVLQRKIASYGLDYEVQTHETAKKIADAIINDIGLDAALNAVRTGKIKGAEAAFIWAAMIDKVGQNIATATSNQEVERLKNLETQLLAEFDRSARDDKGRFLSALATIYQDSDFTYRLSYQIEQYKRVNGGVIPDEVKAQFEQWQKELDEVKKKLAAAEKKLEEQRGQDVVDEIKARKKTVKKTVNTDKAKAIASVLRQGKINKPGLFMASSPASAVWDAAIEAAATTIEATGVLADAIANGIQKIKESDWYKGLDGQTKKQAEKEFSDYVAKSMAETEKPQATITADGKIKIPDALIRGLVEGGIDNINDLVAAIKEMLIEDFPDITDREVRDAITQYGKVLNMSKDEISTTVRKIKRIGKLISQLEDIEEGQRPKRSGLQRDKPDAEERQLMKKVREEMKGLPIDDVTAARELKTALDAIKTRLRNRIEELQNAIANNEEIVKTEKSTEYDAEATALREQAEELKKLYDETFGTPVTDEVLLDRLIKATDRSIEKLEKQIRENDIAFKDKKKLTSAELQQKQARRKELRAELEKMREESGIAEKRKVAQQAKRLERDIAEYQRRLDEGDFSKKPKKLPLQSDELTKLRAEKLAIQDKYATEQYKNELKNRTTKEKWKDAAIELWGLPRLLMATGEMSFILIQGGVPVLHNLLRNPKVVMDAFSKMGQSMISETKFNEFEQLIKAQSFYPTVKASKLALSEYDRKLTAREELGVSGWANTIWDWFFMPTKFISPKVYEAIKKANFLKFFERGGVAFMNQLRLAQFLDGMEKLQREGKTFENNPEDFKALADVVNTFSGRAKLPYNTEASAKALALLFFSPRNWYSQIIQTTPLFFYYMSKWGGKDGSVLKGKPSVAQKLAMMQYMSYMTITISSVLAVAAMLNSEDDDENEVVFDPRSTDFMKVKLGNTRIDPFGGRLQMVIYQLRMMMDVAGYKSYVNSRGEASRLGEGMAPTKFDLTWRLFQNKFSPMLGKLIEYGQTKLRKDKETGDLERFTQYGEKYNIQDRLSESTQPIFWNTIGELYKEQPALVATFLSAVAALGVNISTYEAKKKAKAKKSSLSDGAIKEGSMKDGIMKD